MKTPPLDHAAFARMSSSEDWMDWNGELSEELWMQVLSYVAPLELMESVMFVSLSLRALLATREYWLFHWEALRLSPKCLWLPSDQVTENYTEVYQEDLIRGTLNKHQLQRLCLYWVANRKHEPIPPGLKHGSRLVGRFRAEHIRNRNYSPSDGRVLRRRVCLATTTEHSSELLENVLLGRGPTSRADEIFHNLAILAAAFQQHHRWWSSKPTQETNTQETLLFATNCPLAVLSRLRFKPLLDPFTRGQVYSWRHAVVRAYRLPLHKLDPRPDASNAGFPCTVAVEETAVSSPNDSRGAAAQPNLDDVDDEDRIKSTRREASALRRVLKNETPVYVSPQLNYAPPSSPCTHQRHVPWQRIIFPSTTLANVVTITLTGKDSRQFPHSGYYCCVEQVQLEGIPLLEGTFQNSFAMNAIGMD